MPGSKKKKCPVCGKVVEPTGTFGHFSKAHPEKLAEAGWDEWSRKFEDVDAGTEGTGGANEGNEVPTPTEEREPPREPEEALRPWEVEVVNEAIRFIEERLPSVYGVEKYANMIVRVLSEDPRPLINPNALHAFIKSVAPRAYDSHLSIYVINPLYARFPNLPQAVARLFGDASAPAAYTYTYAAPPAPVYQPAYITPYPASPYAQYGAAIHYVHQPASIPPPPAPRRTYKIVVDGQEIETDEAGYMAWQRFLREREEYERRRQEHEMVMKKLEIEIRKALEGGGESKREEELSRKIEEISRKLEEERERRHQAELELLKREVDELRRRPGLLEELAMYEQVAERLGFRRSGRTTIDLLESFVERLDQRAAQLLSKIPVTGGEWRPEVKRSPGERVRKAEEIIRRLERSEDILKLEEELIMAAAKIRPRTVTDGGEAKA
ncbi:MAG: hypothetical protein QXU69_04620 [Thermofilaceae archaeon]